MRSCGESGGAGRRADFSGALAEAAAVFRYCPSCGSPRLASAAGRSWRCPDCGFEYFHNVATAAAVLLEAGDRLVLLMRAKEPRRGFLAFPGGFVDPGEGAERGALRECAEELGWAPSRLDFLASFPNIYRYGGIPYATCDMFFVARIPGREMPRFAPDPSETSEVLLVSTDAIPWDDIAFPSARAALEEYTLRRGSARRAP